MRTAIAFLLVAVGSVSSGCSLCAPGYLCDYAGVGGKWQRTDPENGRVGSIFSDPTSLVGATSQSAEVADGEAFDYDAVINNSESILESSNLQVPTDDGVVILGDPW